MKKESLIFILYLVIAQLSFGQIVFDQGICKCGVTGDGFSAGFGSGSGYIKPHIPSGSTVVKAYLFTYSWGFPIETPIKVNGVPYYFDNSNLISSQKGPNPLATPYRIYCKDVTSNIDTSTIDSLKVELPQQISPYPNWNFWTTYLWVLYKVPSMTDVSYNIFINNKTLAGNINYQAFNLNPFNTNKPVGFAVYLDRQGNGSGAWCCNSDVVLNTILLGNLNKNDTNSLNYTQTGVKGSFYYENGVLYGLQDDTPDSIMGGSDGLADISSYLLPNDNNLNWRINDVGYPPIQDADSGPIIGFFLTYSTPCSPFPITVSADTTICAGETVQLHASGGIKYEWASTTLSPHDTLSPQSSGNPAPGLSCSDCANPIFSGDSSQVYTVRIWSTDSCSVVRPVRVRVSRPQKLNLTIQDANCGIDNGAVYLNQEYVIGGIDNWSLLIPTGDTLHAINDSSFTQLPAGNYSYYYTDNFGCKSDTWPIQIASYNNTMAYFWVSPGWGTAPLQFDIDNVSLHADHFVWTLNGVGQANPFQSFLADTAGIYTVQLIAWQYDPSCADTMKRTLEVKPAEKSVPISVNTLLTPNGDHKNDTWKITGIEKYPHNEVTVFNRWGNVVFHQENYQNDWNGIPNVKAMGGKGKLPNGTYFYVVTIQNKGKVQVFKGYLEVER